MQYYGFVPQGRRYAEVLVSKEQGQRSTQVETGVVYPTFNAAETGVMNKNLSVSRERYGR